MSRAIDDRTEENVMATCWIIQEKIFDVVCIFSCFLAALSIVLMVMEIEIKSI